MKRLAVFCSLLVFSLVFLFLMPIYAEEIVNSASLCGVTQGQPPFVPDGKYDFSSALFTGFGEAKSFDWPRIFARGIPVRQDQDGTERDLPEAKSEGRFIFVPPRYILTDHHVVNLYEILIMHDTPFGQMSFPEKIARVREESYWIQEKKDGEKIEIKKLLFLPESDIALFILSEKEIFNIQAPSLGRSSELCVAQYLLILGSPGLLGSYVREGIVAAFHFDLPSNQYVSISGGKKLFDTLIGMSIIVYPGDSGSPVLALRDGVPEIVGMVHSSLAGVIGMVLPIDYIVDVVKEKTGIDLRAGK